MAPDCLNPSFLPTQRPESPQKLEKYAQLYAKYTNLIQDQGDAMRHDSQRMQQAYDRVAAEFVAEQDRFATNTLGASYVLADLNEYARRCSRNPESFEDRVRISFAASGFVQILMNSVIGELNQKDREWVLAQASKLMSSLRDSNQPTDIPTFAPAICKLRPENATTSFVTATDYARWQSDPEELVGKVFITTERIMRRTFLVQDYYVGPRFDVVFEDTGLDDVNVLDPQTVLTIVKDAELINVPT